MLPGGFPSCIFVHSDQPKELREMQKQCFNSAHDAFASELRADGYAVEDFRRENISNVMCATKCALPRHGGVERPLAANAVVFNFAWFGREGRRNTFDEDVEDATNDGETTRQYFDAVIASTAGADAREFKTVKIINVLTEDEENEMRARLNDVRVDVATWMTPVEDDAFLR